MGYFRAFLETVIFMGAAEAVVKIGSSLKPNGKDKL